MNDDRKTIIRSIVNKVDPENVLTWILPTSKNGTESETAIHVKYNDAQVASLFFADDNTLRVSVHYHSCDFDLCDKNSFDPDKVALFIARGLYYELLKDGFDTPEIPTDWRISFIERFFNWGTYVVVFGSLLVAVWLFKH